MENDVQVLTKEEATKWSFGLLSPKGEFFGCGYMGHNNLLCDLEDAGKIKHSNTYSQIEEFGWVKYADCLSGKTPMEFTFAFSGSKKASRPAKPGEKSWLMVGGVYMIDYNIDVYHTMTQKQVKFIKDFKKIQNLNTVNFNWREYTIKGFEEHVKECNDNSIEETKNAKTTNVANC